MPPKKSKKSIEAELKKKNTEEAESIIDKLKQISRKSSFANGAQNTTARDTKGSLNVLLRDKSRKTPPKDSKVKKTTGYEKKSSYEAQNTKTKKMPRKTNFVQEMASTSKVCIASKQVTLTTTTKPLATIAVSTSSKSIAEGMSVATATSVAETLIGTTLTYTITSGFDAFNKFDSSDNNIELNMSTEEISVENPLAKADLKRKSANEAKKVEPKSTRLTQETKPADTDNSKHLNSILNHPVDFTTKAAAREYVYEIDCERVGDDVDVTDLQNYLQQELKVNGAKNNLDSNVLICCHNRKVVIKSKVYLPKRSLRFMCKKFIKKKFNIQVISKNTYSYELKYIGTL